MKIKSLLIGSAALMTASSGAYAADAIVMADPEPVEYVRVCDVYGAGFFYIPGTETCLKIGGYVRVELGFPAGFTGYTTLARFAPAFDVRSENEWGTLRGFAELEMNSSWGLFAAPGAAAGAAATTTLGQNNNFNVAHAFIEQTLGGGTLRLGRTHTPYARFLGYGSWSTAGGSYGFRNTQELSYTFSGGNGFSAIVALVDNAGNASWSTDVEAGVNFAQGWGSIGAIAGYDSVAGTWGAKAVLRVGPANGFSAGLHVFYASGAGVYNVGGTNWSVLGHVMYNFSPKAGLGFEAQWFDTGVWAFAAGMDLKPVTGLRIRPEVRYNTGTTAWTGLIRFDRTF